MAGVGAWMMILRPSFGALSIGCHSIIHLPVRSYSVTASPQSATIACMGTGWGIVVWIGYLIEGAFLLRVLVRRWMAWKKAR